MSKPLATFLANPSLNAFKISNCSSSLANMNSLETRAPYSNLIGTIVTGSTDTPPSLFLPFSATISISLSIEKVNSFVPLNGIGVCADKTAKLDLPFTLLIKSVANAGLNKFPLLNTAIINYSFSKFNPSNNSLYPCSRA